MRPALLDEIVAHYRALLGERLVGIALYGSRARGDAREDSDVDLFLVAEGLPADWYERRRAVRLPRLPWRDPDVSVRALTPEEYERNVVAIDLDIAIDARALYDRDGYLASKFALLRRRLDEAGMYRGADLSWHWRRFPSRVDWAIEWDGVQV